MISLNYAKIVLMKKLMPNDNPFTISPGYSLEQYWDPVIPKLTEGEKTALEIRDQVFRHMDGNVSISSLARQYKISEQTMQSSFKSLFGFTPNRFLRLLKLNHVHQELLTSNTGQTTVSRVASKWGFMHMGHFSHYYAELFGKSPSDTLRTPYFQEEYIKEGCAIRREELD